MKRNRYHGLNVEFDGLCIDFGHVSLNKKKEFLCVVIVTYILRQGIECYISWLVVVVYVTV